MLCFRKQQKESRVKNFIFNLASFKKEAIILPELNKLRLKNGSFTKNKNQRIVNS